MQEKLSHIADIRSGVYTQPEQEGDWVYLQLRHFDEAGKIRSGLVADLRQNAKLKKAILQEDDVLVAARGAHYFAYAYQPGDPLAIPSTSFLVLRINAAGRRLVSPAYLASFINLSRTQEYLRQQTQGSSMQALSKAAVSDIQIPIPPLEIQAKLVDLLNAHSQAQALRTRLAALYDQEIQQTIWKALT